MNSTIRDKSEPRRKELQALSAAVARIVMGLDVRQVTEQDGGTAVPGVWLNDIREIAMPGDWYWVDGEGRELAVPKYAESTDVALDILGHLKGDCGENVFIDLSAVCRHLPYSGGSWRAVFTINESVHVAGWGVLLPEAICKAALTLHREGVFRG